MEPGDGEAGFISCPQKKGVTSFLFFFASLELSSVAGIEQTLKNENSMVGSAASWISVSWSYILSEAKAETELCAGPSLGRTTSRPSEWERKTENKLKVVHMLLSQRQLLRKTQLGPTTGCHPDGPCRGPEPQDHLSGESSQFSCVSSPNSPPGTLTPTHIPGDVCWPFEAVARAARCTASSTVLTWTRKCWERYNLWLSWVELRYRSNSSFRETMPKTNTPIWAKGVSLFLHGTSG